MVCVLLRFSSMSWCWGYYQVCSYSGESINLISIYLSEIENFNNQGKIMSLNMQCKWVNFIKGRNKKNYNPFGMPFIKKFFLRIMSFKYALHNHLFIHSIQLIFGVHSFIHLFRFQLIYQAPSMCKAPARCGSWRAPDSPCTWITVPGGTVRT